MMIVVTAASSNHAAPLRYMLASLRRLDAHVECYDLGLTPSEVRALPRWDGLFYHKFDFDSYPPHVNVAINAGEYAWKPAIVAEVVERTRTAAQPQDILWTDAGSYFHALEPIARRIQAGDGLWVRTSSGTIGQWTHPGTLAALGVDPDVYRNRSNADATLIGFATGHRDPSVRERVYRDIVRPWRACAMDRRCIAPEGSSRRNHRQDQAVLSCLVHQAGFAFAGDSRAALGVRCKCDRWFYQYIGFRVPAPVYAWCCLY
jgi:Protein of unknown function (DUF1647)